MSLVDVDSAATNLQLINFKLPPPKELIDDDRAHLIGSAVSRIWNGADELKTSGEIPAESSLAGGNSPTEMWVLLLVRMVTRVAEPLPPDDEGMDEDGTAKEGDGDVVHDFYARQDQLRQTLCDYIMSDFPARCVRIHGISFRLLMLLYCSVRIRLATTWMNEEWYNDRIRLAKDRNWVRHPFLP